MAEKSVYKYKKGASTCDAIYYNQNINKITDFAFSFTINRAEAPREDELVYVSKNNVVYYVDPNNNIRISPDKIGIAHLTEHMFFSNIMPDKEAEKNQPEDFVKASYFDEDKDKNKISQFLAENNMSWNDFFEYRIKNKMYINHTALFKYLKSHNVQYNAYTTQTNVCIYVSSPSKYNEKVLDVISALVLRKEFDPKYLANEKKVVYNELLLTKDDQEGILSNVLGMFENSMSGEEILGKYKEIIDSITANQIARYVKNNFVFENLVTSVVSDRSFNEIDSLLKEKFISKIPSYPKGKHEITKPVSKDIRDVQICLPPDDHMKTAVVSFVLFGSKDFEKNELMKNVENYVFNYFNGRLFNIYRSINAQTYTPQFYAINWADRNIKVFEIVTQKQNVKNVIKAMANMLNEINEKGITPEEYEGFMEMITNGRDRKNSFKVHEATDLISRYYSGSPIFISDFYNKTKNLTMDEINNYFKETLAGPVIMSVGGNYNKNDVCDLQSFINKYRTKDKNLYENSFGKNYDKIYKEIKALDEYTQKHPNNKKTKLVGEQVEQIKAQQEAEEQACVEFIKNITAQIKQQQPQQPEKTKEDDTNNNKQPTQENKDNTTQSKDTNFGKEENELVK